ASAMPDFKDDIRRAFGPDRAPDGDIVEELAQHAAATYEAARADGSGQADAERQVRALIDAWVENARILRRRPAPPPAVDPPSRSRAIGAGLLHDVRYGLRQLRRAPGYALVVVATMALGIGATTTLFSVVYGVLLKPLPWPDSDRLVRVTETRQGRTGRIRGTIANATYLAWRDKPSTIEEIGGWQNLNSARTLSGGGEPMRLQPAIST